MKIEPQPIINHLINVEIKTVGGKVYVYGKSLGTETLLAKFDNPFMSMKDKTTLAKALKSYLRKRINYNNKTTLAKALESYHRKRMDR